MVDSRATVTLDVKVNSAPLDRFNRKIDQMQRKLKGLNGAFGKALNQNRAFGNLNRQLTGATRRMDALARSTGRLAQQSTKVSRQIGNLNRNLRSVATNADRAQRSINRLGSGAGIRRATSQLRAYQRQAQATANAIRGLNRAERAAGNGRRGGAAARRNQVTARNQARDAGVPAPYAVGRRGDRDVTRRSGRLGDAPGAKAHMAAASALQAAAGALMAAAGAMSGSGARTAAALAGVARPSGGLPPAVQAAVIKGSARQLSHKTGLEAANDYAKDFAKSIKGDVAALRNVMRETSGLRNLGPRGRHTTREDRQRVAQAALGLSKRPKNDFEIRRALKDHFRRQRVEQARMPRGIGGATLGSSPLHYAGKFFSDLKLGFGRNRGISDRVKKPLYERRRNRVESARNMFRTNGFLDAGKLAAGVVKAFQSNPLTRSFANKRLQQRLPQVAEQTALIAQKDRAKKHANDLVNERLRRDLPAVAQAVKKIANAAKAQALAQNFIASQKAKHKAVYDAHVVREAPRVKAAQVKRERNAAYNKAVREYDQRRRQDIWAKNEIRRGTVERRGPRILARGREAILSRRQRIAASASVQSQLAATIPGLRVGVLGQNVRERAGTLISNLRRQRIADYVQKLADAREGHKNRRIVGSKSQLSNVSKRLEKAIDKADDRAEAALKKKFGRGSVSGGPLPGMHYAGQFFREIPGDLSRTFNRIAESGRGVVGSFRSMRSNFQQIRSAAMIGSLNERVRQAAGPLPANDPVARAAAIRERAVEKARMVREHRAARVGGDGMSPMMAGGLGGFMSRSSTGLGGRQMGVLAGIYGAYRGLMNSASFDADFRMLSALGGKEGASAVDISALRKKIFKVAGETMFTSADALGAALAAKKAGRSVPEISKMLPTAAYFAAASGMSMTQSTDRLLRVMSGGNVGADKLPSVADAMTSIYTKYNTDLGQMSEGLKYALGPASAQGLSVNQVSATVAAIQDAGLKGGNAGRNLSSFIGKVFGDVSTWKKLKKVGVDISKYMKGSKITDFEGALSDLEKAYRRDGIGLTTALGSKGARLVASLLLQKERLDKLGKTIQQANNASGITKFLAQTQMQGVQGSIKKLEEAASVFFTKTLGDGGLGPAISTALSGMSAMLRVAGDSVQSVIQRLRGAKPQNAEGGGDLKASAAGLFSSLDGLGVAVAGGVAGLIGMKMLGGLKNIMGRLVGAGGKAGMGSILGWLAKRAGPFAALALGLDASNAFQDSRKRRPGDANSPGEILSDLHTLAKNQFHDEVGSDEFKGLRRALIGARRKVGSSSGANRAAAMDRVAESELKLAKYKTRVGMDLNVREQNALKAATSNVSGAYSKHASAVANATGAIQSASKAIRAAAIRSAKGLKSELPQEEGGLWPGLPGDAKGVKVIQRRLNRTRGGLAVDGKWGPKTSRDYIKRVLANETIRAGNAQFGSDVDEFSMFGASKGGKSRADLLAALRRAYSSKVSPEERKKAISDYMNFEKKSKSFAVQTAQMTAAVVNLNGPIAGMGKYGGPGTGDHHPSLKKGPTTGVRNFGGNHPAPTVFPLRGINPQNHMGDTGRGKPVPVVPVNSNGTPKPLPHGGSGLVWPGAGSVSPPPGSPGWLHALKDSFNPIGPAAASGRPGYANRPNRFGFANGMPVDPTGPPKLPGAEQIDAQMATVAASVAAMGGAFGAAGQQAASFGSQLSAAVASVGSLAASAGAAAGALNGVAGAASGAIGTLNAAGARAGAIRSTAPTGRTSPIARGNNGNAGGGFEG